MRILVTGPGGFLGGEITRQLVERGDQVVGVSRGDYPHLATMGVDYRRGDLSDREFTLQTVRDVDAVIHTAAIAGVWGAYERFYRINTTATQWIIEACRAAKIRTLVFTSSPSVTFDGEHQRGVNESVPYPEHWLCAYPQTKALAEQAVLEAHQTGTLHTCSLRPHLIWGDGDPHLIARVLERARRGQLRIVGDGKNLIDTVHVENAAAAHLDALDTLAKKPERCGGRAFFIAQDEPVNCWDWIRRICEAGEAPPPTRRISFRTAYAIGGMLERVYGWLGKESEPRMTRFVAAQLAKDHYFDISAAKDCFDYRVRVSMEEGFHRLQSSLRAGIRSG